MSQNDMIIADAAGAAFLADLNSAIGALVSNSSGATEPATMYAYQLWADTTSGWLKQRNAANSAWIKRFPLGTAARTDIASAATLDLDGNSATSDYLRVTGTTTTTAITLADGQRRFLIANAAWPITHGASLICPGSTSYTCAAGDIVLAIGEPAGVVRLMIWKGDGTAVASGASSGFATGMGMALHTATVPSGWILADGRTIGDASSGATNRANADCQALFTEFWNSYANAELAVSGGRGANAAADWAAHKTIGVPDLRGRTIVGKDNMGGTTASRITSGGSGITGTTLGASGGTETHTLTTAQLASHAHPMATSGGGSGNNTWANSVAGGNADSGSAGSGSAHQNTQPSIVCNYIIKL